ncbi:MAG: MBL fold metallo-hydrolase [Flavobacterium sp.]|nr:MAG: MBL fold metallo-hydrolase [Flavobacterium sp.]
MKTTEILLLKAYHGDSFIIKTFDNDGKEFNILIDGGPPQAFDFELRKQLQNFENLQLLVLTHIDSDHIGGIIKLINNSLFDTLDIEKYWINFQNFIPTPAKSEKISLGEANTLEKLLIDKQVPLKKFSDLILKNSVIDLADGIKAVILSPTQEAFNRVVDNWITLSKEYLTKLEDLKVSGNSKHSQLERGSLELLAKQEFKPIKSLAEDPFNAASMAFILYLPDCKLLLLGDSRCEVIEESLKSIGYNNEENKLKVDYVKVSHHGSRNNTSTSLLSLIDCNNFIFLTNGGGARSKHPDRETLARILYHSGRNFQHQINLIFNYPLKTIEGKAGKLFTSEELIDANCKIFENTSKLP